MPHMKTERGSPDEASDEYDSAIPSTAASNDRSNMVCLVCGDVATGRHYGAIACNGCKGFFRRTIRRNYKYQCRFAGNCQIDKHNRAVCRACRFSRCVQHGMKVDAVQNERDLIGKRPRTHSNSFNSHPNQQQQQQQPNGTVSPPQQIPPVVSSTSMSVVGSAPAASGHFYTSAETGNLNGMDTSTPTSQPQHQQLVNGQARNPNSRHPSGVLSDDPWDSPNMLLDLLMRSEQKIRSLSQSVIRETGKVEYTTKHEPHTIKATGRKATHNDILHSLHSQLLLVIEWAKTLKPFSELGTEDQTALLKNFASQHIVLCVAYRSINASDFLQLINDTCIPRVSGANEGEDDFYRKDCERVMDQLVAPMRFMGLDDSEFVALKACVLFNPVARGLSNENVMKVLDTRRRIFAALEHYVRNKTPYDPNRIGDLTFFILSPLQSLAKSISEDVLVTKLSGMARIDLLMDELILEDTDPKVQKNGIDLRRSLSENDQQIASGQPQQPQQQVSIPPPPPQQQQQGTLTELRAMQIPNSSATNNGSILPGSAPAQYTLDPARSSASAVGNTEMSPIHDYEFQSTLSSYVFGGTLQSPLSPSNDVLFSSAVSMPINSDPLHCSSKLSNCSSSLDPISPPQPQQPQQQQPNQNHQQQQQWPNSVGAPVTSTRPYEYYSNGGATPMTPSNPGSIYSAPSTAPLNF